MKTVMIYDQIGQDAIKFAVLEGDYNHLDKVYINSDDEESALVELSDLIYADDGSEKITFTYEFPIKAVKDGAVVIVCGFLP